VAAQPAGVVLHPGGVACVVRGQRLETLLGSCVAILLTDPRRTLGAMCHVVHASCPAGGHGGNTVYGEAALDAMARLLCQRGLTLRLCQAVVLGGGNMFPTLHGQGHVGERNVAWALQALAGEGVAVVDQDVGGTAYRRVRWTVGDAAAEVARVPVI
jgi:chemotaxis protein CheD